MRVLHINGNYIYSSVHRAMIQHMDGAALGVRVLREQIRIDAVDGCFTASGDAGSAVVNSDGRVVGLLFAGCRTGSTGFASPIVDALAELDVELCVQHQHIGV